MTGVINRIPTKPMKIKTLFLFLLFLLIGCTEKMAVQPPLTSEVSLPADYRQRFIHYATIDRADGITRDIYINPEAAAALRQDGRLPENAVIVIEAYQARKDENNRFHVDTNDHLIPDHPLEMVHVMEKRASWQSADFPTANRTGEWNFGSFHFETRERYDEDLGACFNCHNATNPTDFVYTNRLLQQYIMTGKPQYFRCNLSGRIAC
jgi:hypothetical protein